MKRILIAKLLLVALGLSLGISSGAEAGSTWAVDNRQITLNGDPFTVQGMGYSPVPIGGDDAYVPFGDYFIDEWQSITSRDMEAMRKSNINSVRVYGMWPYLKNSDFSNTGTTASHEDFLSAAYNNGTDPIYVFAAYSISADIFHYEVVDSKPTDGSWYAVLPTAPGGGDQIWVEDTDYNNGAGATYRSTVESEYKMLVNQIKDDPAVMGFVISNELNSLQNVNNPTFWSWINGLAGDIKALAPDKLTMTSLVDDSMASVPLAEKLASKMPNLDVWGINSYRGTETTGFDDLFSTFEAASQKALLVTEYGCPASTRDGQGNIALLPNNADDQANYIAAHWKDIENHSAIASGGYVFEWTDEWWKVPQTPSTHDAGSAANGAFPGGWDDEEWFGINGVKVTNRSASDPWNPGQPNAADTLLPRKAVATLKTLWQ